MTTANMPGRKATVPTKLVAKKETTKKLRRSTGSASAPAQSGATIPTARVMPAATMASSSAKMMTMIRPNIIFFLEMKPARLLDHGHGAQCHSFPRGQFFGCALELATGGQNVAAARRANRRSITGIEHDLRELLNLFPLRALVSRARPRVERDQIDLGGDAF